MNEGQTNPTSALRWETLLEELITGVSTRAGREELLRLSREHGASLLLLREEHPSLFEQLSWQATESKLHLHLPLQHKRRPWYESGSLEEQGGLEEPQGWIEGFPMIRLLREGSFGSRTYLSRHEEGFLCLLKIYEPSSVGLTGERMFQHQERMMQRLHQIEDPEVEEVLEHFLREDGSYVQVKPFLSCVSLWDWMLSYPYLEARKALAVRIGRTLQALHQQGVAHIDFKPDQILVLVDPNDGVLEEEPEFVLIDYDFSMVEGELLVAVGSAPYFAPEQFAREIPKGQDAGEKIDTYAFAIFLHRMFSGKYPFGDGRTKPTHLLQLKQQRRWSSFWIPHKPLRRLLKRALHPNPEKRPTLEAILKCLNSPAMEELVSRSKDLWNDDHSTLGQYWLPLSGMATIFVSLLWLLWSLNLVIWIPGFLLFFVPALFVWLRWLSRTR